MRIDNFFLTSLSQRILFILYVFATVFFLLPDVALAGNVSGSAWSAQIGWVNFGTSNGNANVTSSAVTGYAWNENHGWLNLNPSNSGIINDGNGNLSGRAWLEGIGWINFSGVTINSSGVFAGTANGDNDVVVSLGCTNCQVTTDWRAASTSTTGSVSGGIQTVAKPKEPLGISINNGSQYTNNLAVTLYLTAGSDVDKVTLSNFSDFAGGIQENYQKTKVWALTEGDGKKTVFAKFYTKEGGASQPVFAIIILDRQPPEVKITSLKDRYRIDEQVLIGGTTENSAKVDILIDNSSYGALRADEQRKWIANLGKMNLGSHNLEISAVDLAGNKSKIVEVAFLVEQVEGEGEEKKGEEEKKEEQKVTLAPPLAPLFRKITELLQPLIPKLFNPITKLPPPLVTVPKEPPTALKGSFHYLSTVVLSRFVLAPLPADIKLLAQQFPQVQKTFEETGIQRFTDITKLTETKLQLPSLTQTVSPVPKFTVAKFAPPKGISIAGLSASARSKIPAGVVFVKTAGGLVDFNTALSINDQGKTEQKVKALANQPLQLVVRTEESVKDVRGFLIFKSKKYNQPSYEVPLNYLSSSMVFENPNLTAAVAPHLLVSLEGSYKKNKQQEQSEKTKDIEQLEQRLVLLEFNYNDQGSNLYTAEIQLPPVDGEYEIITIFDSEKESREIRLITVVDPEGYVYKKNGNLETRISDAVVSLYWLNPSTRQYQLWPSGDFQQLNPQITDSRGTYSFLVPNGFYYLKVEAPGYFNYNGKPFEVVEGSGIHINIELTRRSWILNFLDFKDIVLIAITLMLIYNFYRDRKGKRKEKEEALKEEATYLKNFLK